jgi:cell wall assembly regulator SMI1
MTEIENNLNRIWNSLEQKAPQLISLFQPGLKREEIDKITKNLPFKLPKEVYELYQLLNGFSDNIELKFGLINEPQVFREVWCLIPFDKIVIVCEKPKIVWSKNNTQYGIEQPDISFSDGYCV